MGLIEQIERERVFLDTLDYDTKRRMEAVAMVLGEHRDAEGLRQPIRLSWQMLADVVRTAVDPEASVKRMTAEMEARAERDCPKRFSL